MRIFLNLISICIIAVVGYFATLNSKMMVDFVLLNFNTHKTFIVHLPMVYLILGIFLIGMLSGLFWALAFSIPVRNKLKEYQKKLEKTKVQTSEEISRVGVLEAKIETLERALDSALKKN